MTTLIGCRCKGGNVCSRAILIARRLIVQIFFNRLREIVCVFFRYVKILVPSKKWKAKNLGWPLQRGSPLPIPNREVKPVSADGTAFVGE